MIAFKPFNFIQEFWYVGVGVEIKILKSHEVNVNNRRHTSHKQTPMGLFMKH